MKLRFIEKVIWQIDGKYVVANAHHTNNNRYSNINSQYYQLVFQTLPLIITQPTTPRTTNKQT